MIKVGGTISSHLNYFETKRTEVAQFFQLPQFDLWHGLKFRKVKMISTQSSLERDDPSLVWIVESKGWIDSMKIDFDP